MTVMPLFSGSSGNSVYFNYRGYECLIDAGVSCASLCRALKQVGSDLSRIQAIFVTHEHVDHVRGLEVILKKRKIPVYINSASAEALCPSQQHPFWDSFVVKNDGDVFSCGEMEVQAFQTPHDAAGSVGYRFSMPNGESFGYATDIGYVTKRIAKALFGCATVVFESNHDVDMLNKGRYPYYLKRRILSDRGHLSNAACAEFLPHLVENGARKIILAHLSAENNRPEVAYGASARALSACGATAKDVTLSVAMRSIL